MQERVVFVGSYGNKNAEAIQVLEVSPSEGSLRYRNGVGGIDSPSFLAFDAAGNRLYAVSETDAGEVVSYQFHPETFGLEELNRQPTHGAAPCYVSIDDGYLYVANYNSGNICVYPLSSGGEIGEATCVIEYSGTGTVPSRQDSPHAHAVVVDPLSHRVLATDLGTDHIRIYRNEDGVLYETEVLSTPAGSGPRHLAFDSESKHLYVISELNSTMLVYRRNQLNLFDHVQTVDLLPVDDTMVRWSAHLVFDENHHRLYASNRGPDNLTIFAVDSDGLLTTLGCVQSGGKTPRHFAMTQDGYILVANQDSDEIATLRLDGGENGMPVDTGARYHMFRPVCVVEAR